MEIRLLDREQHDRSMSNQLDSALQRLDRATKSRFDREEVMEAQAAFVDEVLAACGNSAAPQVEGPQSGILSNPVFICGVHKSGTTLVRNLLDWHPDLYVLPEDGPDYSAFHTGPEPIVRKFLEKATVHVRMNNAHEFWVYSGGRADAAPYVRFARYCFAYIKSLEDSAAGRFSALLLASRDAGHAGNDNPLLAHKATLHWHHAGEIFNTFPAAKMVHIVRHPCGTYASAKARRKMMGETFSPYRQIDSIRQGLIAAQRNLDRFGEERYKVVKYEDLLGHPETTMRSIAGFLSIPYVDVLLQPTLLGRPQGANSGHAAAVDSAAPLNKESREYWTRSLSDAEVRLIGNALKQCMKTHGYEPRASNIVQRVSDAAVVVNESRRQAHVGDFGIRTLIRMIAGI